MEKHKNLSIFVPHEGCPNQCSFCDQKKISGTQNPPTPRQVIRLCEEFLPTDAENGKSYEIAFFGGSFTAIDRQYMIRLLEAARPFVRRGRAMGIRVSTRPDAIDKEVLDLLKHYGVTSIELGAQSMQDTVLKANLRGHSVQAVYDASKMIKQWGFSLGLQMMTGLYRQENYMEYAVDTAEKFIEIGPDTVRIYPTLTLKDTLLEKLYQKGIYAPPDIRQTVEICAVLVKMFNKRGIKIIKLGLHADTGLEKSLVAGPYHPAFKELVQSHLFLEELRAVLDPKPSGKYEVRVHPSMLSQAIGQKKSNVRALADLGWHIKFAPDISLRAGEFVICEKGEERCI